MVDKAQPIIQRVAKPKPIPKVKVPRVAKVAIPKRAKRPDADMDDLMPSLDEDLFDIASELGVGINRFD